MLRLEERVRRLFVFSPLGRLEERCVKEIRCVHLKTVKVSDPFSVSGSSQFDLPRSALWFVELG